MDEINYKIDSQNPIISSEAIHLIIKSIMKMIDENKTTTQLDEHYQLLKDKCGSENSLISSTASQGLLNLIKFGYMELDSALTMALSVVLTANSFSGISSVISNIMEMMVLNDIKENKTYTCKWNINSPTHPFIVMVKFHQNSIPDVYNEMKQLCSKESRVYMHCIELLRPVFIWILCHPEQLYPLVEYNKFLELILSLNGLPQQKNLILECLGWQQISTIKCLHTYETYSVIVEWAMKNKSNKLILALLPAIANIAHSLTIYCKNPKPCLTLLKRMIEYLSISGLKSNEFNMVINCIGCMIAETIRQCPVAYMAEWIEICKQLCLILRCPIAISTMTAAFLQWNYNKNLLTIDFNDELRNVLDILRNYDTKLYSWESVNINNDIFDYFASINRRIFIANELCKNYKILITNRNAYSKWKKNWDKSSNKYLQSEHVLYLQGLLVLNAPNIDYDKVEILKIIGETLNLNHELMMGQLPITLYCLSLSSQPAETIELLKLIPKLGVLRENIPVVIGILKMLENNQHSNNITFIKSSISGFVINLYMKLVEKQIRCYPYLHTILAKTLTENISKNWELSTAQASAVKQICEGREVNANEIVPILSEIIKQSTTSESAIACCLCLEAVGILWKKDIIDPQNTWQILGPKFANEERNSVNISICKLLGIIPEIYQNPFEHEDFIENVIKKLWKYIITHHTEEICNAAFTAISKFKLENFTLKQIPDVYKFGIKLPANIEKISAEANPKPEDVLNYIPSIVWGNLFKNTNIKLLSGVGILCHKLMEREVASYRSVIWNTNIAEPDNVKYLPSASVVRGVIEFTRREIMESKGELSDVAYAALRCLTMPLSKPLPSVNWTFLYEILNNESTNMDIKLSILQLLAQQAETSLSAMKILVDFLETVTKTADMYLVFEILQKLCKCVKPKKLSTAIGNCTECAYFLMTTKDKSTKDSELFSYSLPYFADCFKDETIEYGVKESLSNILLKYWDEISFKNDIWPKYAEACSHLPDEVLKKIVLPINEKSCNLRSILALDKNTENCLDWLNDIVDAGITNSSDDKAMYLSALSAVLSEVDPENQHTINWFIQLLLRIQIELLNETVSERSVEFLCDTVITCVIVMSNYKIYGCGDELMLNTMEKLVIFPQVVNSYFENMSNLELLNIGSHVMKWLLRNKSNPMIPKEMQKAFDLAVICSRHSPQLHNQETWANFVGAQTELHITNIL